LPGWPEVYSHYDGLEVAQVAFRIFFSLLYNADLSLEQCTRSADIHGHTLTLVEMTVIVCSYAKFVGNLDFVGPRMSAILRSSPGFWELVADTPEFFLLLGKKLDSEELYQETVRHMVAHAHLHNDWTKVVSLGKNSEKQVHQFYKPQLKELEQTMKQLNKSLHRLQLEPVKLPEHNTRFRWAVTRYIDAIVFKNPKNLVCWSPLARKIFGDFLVCELFGENVTAGERGVESEKAG
jgi:hypothetical protein